jgi:putative flippase GtrA
LPGREIVAVATLPANDIDLSRAIVPAGRALHLASQAKSGIIQPVPPSWLRIIGLYIDGEDPLEYLLTRTQTNRKELTRFVKFMVVGVVGAGVDFGIYNLLNEVFHVLPEFSGSISFVLAICSNFFWNRFWTYPDSRSKPIVQQFFQFFIVNALGIVIRLPIIALLRQPFGSVAGQVVVLEAEQAETLGNNLALALAVFIVMFWNFFVNRFWTYSDVGKWGRSQPSVQDRSFAAYARDDGTRE